MGNRGAGGLENVLYPNGDDIEKTQANFFSADTIAVMSYAPNTYGLYDMAGNVYEWCHDWYGYNYYESSVQEPENPKGPLQGVYRVLRGGCWKSLKKISVVLVVIAIIQEQSMALTDFAVLLMCNRSLLIALLTFIYNGFLCHLFYLFVLQTFAGRQLRKAFYVTWLLVNPLAVP